ncbi:TnpV protein [Ruminococcus sp.]|uniref:TnpV protein n=1 Tax=Ruminococcus sp. TaxID=41978 RepID=UPI00388D0B4C
MTEITYTRQGDYNLPDLTLPDQPQVELGMYAQLRRRFLKEQHRVLYYNLLTKCKLTQHLHDIEQTAMKMENNIIRRMAQQQGVTEQLKAQNQLLWVGLMNNILQSARETVMNEVIYTV